MSGLLLPIVLFVGALAATFLTYRNIRRGGARFYTLEREVILRRAAITLIAAAGLYTATLALLYLQRQDLITASLPPGEGTAAADGTAGPQVTTPTSQLEQFPPTATATSTTPQPTITPTPVVCRGNVEGSGSSGIYLRDAPQGAEVVIIDEGTLLTILPDAPVDAGGIIWRKVRLVGGEEGWAAADFITIRQPCPIE